jgi:hypothetical protein
MKYRLQEGDYIDLGNEVLFEVEKATFHNLPKPNSSKVINIRYLDESDSKAGSEIMSKAENLIKEGETPKLKLVFKSDNMHGK